MFLVHHLLITHRSVHMSTSDIAATLHLSEMSANPLKLNDGSLVLNESAAEYSKVSRSVLDRRSGVVCAYGQVISHIVNPYLAAFDGAFSGQAFPGGPDTPSLVRNVPDHNARLSVIQSRRLSHGCQCQGLSYLSHKAISYSGHPTRSVTYDRTSRFIEPQRAGLLMIPQFMD